MKSQGFFHVPKPWGFSNYRISMLVFAGKWPTQRIQSLFIVPSKNLPFQRWNPLKAVTFESMIFRTCSRKPSHLKTRLQSAKFQFSDLSHPETLPMWPASGRRLEQGRGDVTSDLVAGCIRKLIFSEDTVVSLLVGHGFLEYHHNLWTTSVCIIFLGESPWLMIYQNFPSEKVGHPWKTEFGQGSPDRFWVKGFISDVWKVLSQYFTHVGFLCAEKPNTFLEPYRIKSILDWTPLVVTKKLGENKALKITTFISSQRETLKGERSL